ncbi:hypothetical protein T4D_10957 [Trichinella pseudospiralis]|uniref:Uncharacterized protein n=1 Tax=Trichinella pseudospiralis TaxID=6337 RepID=A0A0V1FI54_TRIPS|nr:hypothetical protein T4D_10957 [Trichinella pseudospiralis]
MYHMFIIIQCIKLAESLCFDYLTKALFIELIDLLNILCTFRMSNWGAIAFQILEFDFTFKYPDMRYK